MKRANGLAIGVSSHFTGWKAGTCESLFLFFCLFLFGLFDLLEQAGQFLRINDVFSATKAAAITLLDTDLRRPAIVVGQLPVRLDVDQCFQAELVFAKLDQLAIGVTAMVDNATGNTRFENAAFAKVHTVERGVTLFIDDLSVNFHHQFTGHESSPGKNTPTRTAGQFPDFQVFALKFEHVDKILTHGLQVLTGKKSLEKAHHN